MLFKFISIGLILVLSVFLAKPISAQISLLSAINCPFNAGLCSWTTSINPNPWTLRTRYTNPTAFNSIQFMGPAKGAFTNNNFVQVYQPTNRGMGVNADLISPKLQSKLTSDCISFYYYIHGEGARYIQLQIVTAQSTQVIWTRRNSAGDMWHYYSINIGAQQLNYQLKFSVSSGYGAVGLSFLTIQPGVCSPNNLCDFESGNCNWTSTATNPSYKFTLTQAGSAAWGVASSNNDHSTETNFGHFMEATGGNTGDATNMTSPPFNYYSVPFCLRFWYWRHLSQNNRIDVITRTNSVENVIWTSENRIFPSKMWHRAQVTFFMKYGLQLVIRATRLVSVKSPVDIDDISLLTTSCPLPINCDFNQDMCGWTRDLDQNWIWDHGIGRVENSKVLPAVINMRPMDRTVREAGMFMYTDFTQKVDTSLGRMVMTSEYVDPPVGGSACLSLYYYAVDFVDSRNQFNIYKIDSSGTRTTLKTIGVQQSSGWQPLSVDFQSTTLFRISLEVIGYSGATYLAVDDIIYKAGSCNSVPTVTAIMPTLPTQPPDATLSCNFEAQTICNWHNSISQSFGSTIWTVTTAVNGYTNIYALMPRADHTLNSNFGHYAYLVHRPSDMSRFINQYRSSMSITNNGVTPNTNTPYCFSLWYYMKANGYVQLNVTAVGPNNELANAASRENGQGEQWNMLQMEVPGDKNGYVYTISALARLGVVAIDDIKVVHQPCGQTDQRVSKCTFEGGNNCSFSPTYNPNGFRLNWQLWRGTETYITTYDHTLKTYLGHYYALDFYVLKRLGFTTTSTYKILSRKLDPTPQTCLTFSYFMSGLKNNESLNFYVGNTTYSYGRPIWSAFGDFGPFWYSHRVTVSSQFPWQIGFDVTTHNSDTGLIAIDDVIVETGRACPPRGMCDFERKDTCMWESIPQNNTVGITQAIKMSWAAIAVGTSFTNFNVLRFTDFEWIVHSPDTFIDPLFPIMDHTLNKRSGNYLLLKGLAPRRAGDRAVLVSDHYDIDTNRSFCLSLYYYIKNPNNIGNSKFEIYQAENYNQYKKIGEVIGQSTSPNWMQYNVTAKALSTGSKNMWFYLVGDIGTVTGSAIAISRAYKGVLPTAIDDISIISGSCMGSQTTPTNKTYQCLPTAQVIPKIKLCDGIKDCVNGADELSCGTCDFKTDCGFHESVPLNNDKMGYQYRLGNNTIGPKSGPYGTSSFIVAQAYRYSQYVERSDLFSPNIFGSKAGCYVLFYYNLNGSMTAPTIKNRWSHLSIQVDRGFEKSEIWNSDAINVLNGVWMRGLAFIGRVQNKFTVTYEASDYSPAGSYGYVALGNVRMVGCYLNTTTTGQCVPNPSYICCRNGNYVSKQYLCDFSDDCGDSTDELPNTCTDYTNRCDFENGFCIWGRYSTGSWKLDDGYSSVLTGPTRDHTKGIRSGKYLTLRSNYLSVTTSDIYGPTLMPSRNCQMRFWLTMEGNASNTGSVMIAAQNLQTGVLTPIWQTYPSQFPMRQFAFTRYVFSMPYLTYQYRIIIRGNLSAHGMPSQTSRQFSYIAIDDISFTPECSISTATVIPGQSTPRPIATTPNPCGNTNQFKCKTSGQCIDNSKVCNFHDDCGDNSDEQNCGKCGFEQTDALGRPSMCGWHNIGVSKSQWVVRKGSDFSSYNGNLPRHDSNQNSSGKFLIIDTSSGGTSIGPAILQSALLGATSPNCRLTFKYTHFYPSTSRAVLSVYLYRRQFYVIKKQLFTVAISNEYWNDYFVHIGQLPAGYRIQFEGTGVLTAGTQPYIDMSLDEIQFVDCDPQVTAVSNLTCDFELGTCGWYDLNIASNNKLDWIRGRISYEMPGHDHTSLIRPRPARFGYWMYTHRNPGMVGNDTATLMTSSSQPATTAPKCLTFWYHLFGRDSANLTLIINTVQSPFAGMPRVLWAKRTPQSNNWVQGQINIPQTNSPYYLMFRASLMANSRDTIGLDDITYTDGACPSTSICDFEIDLCNWVSTNAGGFIRTSAVLTASTIKVPPIDHTLGAPDGSYIRVKGANQKQTLSYKIPLDISANHTLPSSFIPRAMCLKFWYYMGAIQSGHGYIPSSSDYFNVSTSRVQNFDGITARTVSMFQNYMQWIYRRVPMSVAPNDYVYLSAGIGNTNSIVAFDDIQVQKFMCESPGSCDFENDFCGYSNAKSKDNTRQIFWLRNTGITESDISGPDRDHTTDTDDGWYVYVPEDAQTNGVAILQSEILGPYVSSICFSFYYHIQSENTAVSPKLNVRYMSPFATNATQIANISSSSLNRWIKFSQTFNNLPQGRFQFTTFQGQTSRADVALDDISVQPGICGQIQPTINPIVTTTEPIQNMQWDCNFETGCKWTVPNGAQIGWKVSSWATNQKVGPRVDHTMRLTTGHYLLYDGSTPNAANPLIYTSDPVSGPYNSSYPACFSFWYYLDSESKFNLTFGYYPTPSATSLIAMYKITGSFASRQWKLGQKTVYVIAKSRLSIQLSHSTPFIGSLAIDDIKLSTGQCKYDNGQECDFSTGYCGYSVMRTTIPTGRITAGYVVDSLTRTQTFGPTTDHTSGEPFGFYFWFTKPLPPNNVTNYRTNLVIPDLSPVGFRPQCLTFWYQINTQTNSSFYIYVAPNTQVSFGQPQWVVPYTHFDRWTRGQLTIYAQYMHKIAFSLNIPQFSPDNTFIALDDISLKSGQCEQPVSCDFDTDMCSWTNAKIDLATLNWAKFTGPPGVNSNWSGPVYDHTLGRSGGSYLYLTVPQSNPPMDRIGEIESMLIQMLTPKCLSFWIGMIGSDERVEVILVRYGLNITLNNNNHTYQLSEAIVGPKPVWSKFSISIDPKQFPNTTAYQIRIKGKVSTGTQSKSFIALDDVLLVEGLCPNPITNLMFCKGTGIQYDSSKRCNFVYDCPQKDDEDNCGNCDFEKDTCNWGNKALNAEQWVRKGASDQIAPTGPKTDGQNSAVGHYMVVNPLMRISNRADLTTNRTAVNQLKRSYFSCVMSFKYFMSANALKRNSTYFMVNIGSNINYDRTVWRMNGQTLDKWTQASATIGDQDANFNVDIVGAFTGQATVLAVDDIQFNNCNPPVPSANGCPPNQIQCKNKVCVSPYVLCDGVNDCGDQSDEYLDYCQKLKVNKCSFEPNQGSQVSCNWTQEYDTANNALWRPMASASANTAANMIRMTGPTFDRTFRIATRGTFMVLRGQPKDYNKKTRFVTHMVTAANGQTCALRFFYYMFGSQIGSLSISIRYYDPNIKSTVNPILITGNQGQQWKRAILPVSDQRAFQFIIEGQVGTGPQSDIAIDEISFSEGCLPSDTKPIIRTTTTGPNVTPTKSTILNKNTPNKPNSNSGKIAAGVLVPLFVIGAIIGFLYYRRYHQRKHEEDRVAIADQVFYSNDSVETHLDRKNPNVQK